MGNKPKLVIITGRPGSGKTTLAKKLGDLVHMPVLCRDEFKEDYVHTFGKHHNNLPDDTNKIATETYFSTIEFLLKANISLIAEAAFQHKVWDVLYKKVSDLCEINVILCEVDPELAAKRHLKRGLEDDTREYFHGDNRVAHYKETGELLKPNEYQPPQFDVRIMKASTEDGYEPSLKEIKKFLER